jgi:osmotically-inducible protein OsmY
MSKQTFALETAVRGNWGLNTLDFQNVRVYAREDGVVTLEGAVIVPGRKEEAEAAARATPGVTKVINNIQIAGGQ